MNRTRYAIWLLLLGLSCMAIAFASSYAKTAHYMSGVNFIKESSKVVK